VSVLLGIDGFGRRSARSSASPILRFLACSMRLPPRLAETAGKNPSERLQRYGRGRGCGYGCNSAC
jgi:hypothetical protein